MTRPEDEQHGDDLDERDDPDESDMDDSDEPELVQCPHCGKYVNEEADRCHHCGQYVKGSRSMPMWVIITAIILILVCGFGVYFGIS